MALSPHRIRLQGPWLLTCPALGPGIQTVSLPAGWTTLGLDRTPAAVGRLERRFNQPTRLQPTDRVELVITGALGATVSLNASPAVFVDIAAGFRLSVGPRLAHTNSLVLEFNPLPAVPPTVTLEITPGFGIGPAANLCPP